VKRLALAARSREVCKNAALAGALWPCASTCSRGLGGDGKPWRIGTEVYGDRDILPRDVISGKLNLPRIQN